MSEPRHGAPPRGGALSTIFNQVVSGLNGLGSVWIFVIMILMNLDAFGRKLFAAPIYGVNEIVELSIVGIVFLQLGDATRRGRLTRSDGFFRFMLRRAPRVGRVLGAAFDFLGIVFMAIILYGSVPLLIESVDKGFYIGEEGLATFPVWPVKLVIVIGCLATALQFLAFTRRYLVAEGAAEPAAHAE